MTETNEIPSRWIYRRLHLEPVYARSTIRFLIILALLEFARNGLYFGHLNILAAHAPTVTLGWIGALASIHFLTDTIGRSPGGYGVQKFGLGPMMLVSATLALISAGALLMLEQPIFMLMAALLHGASAAPWFPGIMAQVKRSVKPGYQALVLGLVFAALGPCYMAGWLIIGTLTRHHVAWGAGGILISQLLALGLALASCKDRHASGIGFHPLETLWRLRHQLRWLTPAGFTQMFAGAMFGPLIWAYLDLLHMKTAHLLVGGGLFGAIMVGSLHRAGHWVERRGARSPLILGYLCSALMLFGMMPPPAWWQAALALAAGGIGFALIFPAWNGMVITQLPDRQLETAWGALMTIEGLGMAAGPVIGTCLWQYSPQAPFIMGGSVYLLVALFYCFKPMPTQPSPPGSHRGSVE